MKICVRGANCVRLLLVVVRPETIVWCVRRVAERTSCSEVELCAHSFTVNPIRIRGAFSDLRVVRVSCIARTQFNVEEYTRWCIGLLRRDY